MNSTQPDLAKIYEEAVKAHQQNNFEQAEKLYNQVLQYDPGNFGVLNNLSIIFDKQNKVGKAIELCNEMIKVKPDFPGAYNRLGVLHMKIGKFSEAAEFYQRALDLKKDHNILFNISVAFYFLKRYSEAEQALLESLIDFPNNPAACVNLAILYMDIDELEKSDSYCKKALELNPDNDDVNYNFGLIKSRLGDVKTAIDFQKKALKANPNHHKAGVELLKELKNICDWEAVDKILPGIKELTDKQIEHGVCPGMTPFLYLSLTDNPEDNLNLSNMWAEDIRKNARIVSQDNGFDFFKREKDENKKLRIGYLSFDYRDHPFAHLTKELFALHNKEEFEICAYATSGDDGSEIRKIYEEGAYKFTTIFGMGDLEAAKHIYEDRIDVLFDFTGYTNGSRTGIAALRPAPVLVNMWGYPGTIGGDVFDYTVADELIIPEEHQQYYSEEIVYLPDQVQIAHQGEKISDTDFTRQQFGLPEEGFVFCSLNPTYKFEPVMFSIWMDLLKEAPDSVLWLRKTSELAEDNLKSFAKKCGVNEERIIFAERLEDRTDYFKRMQLADLALDTRIYNGGSTTIDALWAGVPVITLLGNHYPSRMSASHIKAVDIPELIANSLEEYKELALKLAKNPEELKKLREKLWKTRKNCNLFNTERYVSNLEKACKIMWKNWSQGKKPQKINVF